MADVAPVSAPRPAAAAAAPAALVLATIAAVAYNMWPLGFRLDRAGMRGTYISVLEVPGRPDAHVFVGFDVLAGLLAITAGVLLRRHHGLIALGLAVFGIGNILEASIPIDATCATSVASCGTGPGAVLAPHDLASLISLAGLAAALWALRDHSRWMRGVIGLWAVTGLFMVGSVVVVRWVTVSQASFLIGCGVALVAVPLAMLRPADRG